MTRRAGRGWPTIFLLAFAFGVVEEGLLTQSLFDPDYLGLHKLAYGYLPSLGIGLPWTIFVLAFHTIWSISAPIAVAESFFPGRSPWLGPRPLAGLAALYVLTGAVIAVGSRAATTFRPSAAQLVATVVVALVAVAAAFGMRRVPADSPASGSGPVGAVLTFVLLSLFHLGHEAGPPWFACTVMVVTLALLGFALWRWRFPAGAVGAGAVAVYAWVGLANAVEHGAAAVAEQVVIVVLVLGVLALEFRPRPRTRTPRDAWSSSRH